MKRLAKGPALLLLAAFALAGAKSPQAFGLWSCVSLLYSCSMIYIHPPSDRRTAYFILFLGGVVLSQIYSLDSTNSLFWTGQCLVFLFLWLALGRWSQNSDPSDSGLWQTVWVLGAITSAVTTYQWLMHRPIIGVLPINPNFNAVWLAALAVALAAKTRAHFMEKFLSFWLSALVIFGRSRSGFVALVAGLLYCAWQKYPRHFVWRGLGIAGLAALLAPHGWLLNRMYVIENGARLRLWGIALRALADYPLTGYGLGNFEMAYLKYAFPVEEAVRFGHTTSFVHNDYLQLFCELGWPTAGLLCVGFATSLLIPVSSHHPFAVPAKAMLLVLAVAAFFNPIFRMPIFVYLALLCAAILIPMDQTMGDRGPKSTILKAGLYLTMAFTFFVVLWSAIRFERASGEHWDRVLAWNARDAEAWHQIAYQTSDSNLALAYHKKAVEESPHQLYYVEGLARALENRHEKDSVAQALEMYLRAIQLAPSRAINYLAVARLLWRAGEPAEALLWTEKARGLEPYYWESDLWRSRCLDKLGKRRQAIFTLKNLVRRRQAFLKLFPIEPTSSYERAILEYDETVVRNELARS